ncbi:hypothetical protein L3X38_004583 [Prunus dulcis]|uniref:Uncharacterized protein n=1 Tax=Prunus dulcis TaxID=3755 RepID=A0AAD5F3A4_PRUDU|nr:hypothetical protein L3X38_004583 [Prunus dulcis]
MPVGMLNLSRQGCHRGSKTWTDVGILKGLLPEQKLTAFLWMLAFSASTNQVDEIARMGKSIILESLVRFCDAIETLYMMDYLSKPTLRDLQRFLQKGRSSRFPKHD